LLKRRFDDGRESVVEGLVGREGVGVVFVEEEAMDGVERRVGVIVRDEEDDCDCDGGAGAAPGIKEEKSEYEAY
jgi:hypothetical protein